MSSPIKLTFAELKARDPPFNTWGLYGEANELGRLNLITPEAVQRGLAAAKHGIRVNLNLPLVNSPFQSKRGIVEHKIIDQGWFFDDQVTFNTQCSTQWDGFLHVPYQNYPSHGHYTYHGGITHEKIKSGENKKFGINNFADHPITTRAVLLDLVAWRKRTNQPPLPPLKQTPVKLADLKACAKDEGVSFEPGDVLVINTGFTEALAAMTDKEREGYDCWMGAIGVESTEEVMQWHWENGFAAVASDAFAYETFPFAKDRISIHEIFIAGWGLPLGELFDLRALCAQCDKLKQYTFLLTTMTLNYEGGIASPPNAQAIL